MQGEVVEDVLGLAVVLEEARYRGLLHAPKEAHQEHQRAQDELVVEVVLQQLEGCNQDPVLVEAVAELLQLVLARDVVEDLSKLIPYLEDLVFYAGARVHQLAHQQFQQLSRLLAELLGVGGLADRVHHPQRWRRRLLVLRVQHAANGEYQLLVNYFVYLISALELTQNELDDFEDLDADVCVRTRILQDQVYRVQEGLPVVLVHQAGEELALNLRAQLEEDVVQDPELR